MRFIKSNVLLSIFALTLIFGCKNYGKLEEIGAPNWVFDSVSVAKDSNEVSAVGIGEPSKGGLKIQLAQADADSRANIASQLLSEVSRISKDAMRKTNIANVEDVEKIFSQATQEVVRELPLSGTTRTHIWQDPKTDVLYVRMVIDGKKIASHLNDSMEIYDKRLKQSGLDLSQNNNNLLSTFTKDIDDKFGSDSSAKTKIDKPSVGNSNIKITE